MQSNTATLVPAALIIALVGCVNITINFPAAEVEAAARKIERDVRGAQPPTPAPQPPPPRSEIRQRRAPVFGTASAYAAEIDLKVDSPLVRAATASRKQRYPQIKPYLDSGALGEGKNALLVVRSVEGLDPRTRVALNQLVAAENKDRNDLFKEISRLNNLSELDKVQAAFAAAIRSEMESGQWFEDDQGEWKQKK
jgi:uncharacterized protein YdbL (DUF1318 family)